MTPAKLRELLDKMSIKMVVPENSCQGWFMAEWTLCEVFGVSHRSLFGRICRRVVSGVENWSGPVARVFTTGPFLLVKMGVLQAGLLLSWTGLLQEANLSFKSPSSKPLLSWTGSVFALPIFSQFCTANFLSSYLLGDVPRKLLQAKSHQNPAKCIQWKSPTHFCRLVRPIAVELLVKSWNGEGLSASFLEIFNRCELNCREEKVCTATMETLLFCLSFLGAEASGGAYTFSLFSQEKKVYTIAFFALWPRVGRQSEKEGAPRWWCILFFVPELVAIQLFSKAIVNLKLC